MSAWQSSTSDRIGTLERDHRALLLAFGAAFVFIIVMFAAGYLSLAAKLDAGFDRVSSKIDLMASDVSAVKADVAVLKANAGAASDPDRPVRR
ncbi:MAG: hypothetical protein K2X25_00700 [Caulobacteraceae bacterium]|nr:hypothetical protein [Caulobacteraceae bacterium]